MRTDGRTDRHDEANSSVFEILRKRLKMGVLKDYFRRKVPQQEGEEINVDRIR
jgi:hypothetical protein